MIVLKDIIDSFCLKKHEVLQKFLFILFDGLCAADPNDLPGLDEWTPLEYTDGFLDQKDLYCYLKLVPFQFRRQFKFLFGSFLPSLGLLRGLIKYFSLSNSLDFTIVSQGRQVVNPSFPALTANAYHIERRSCGRSLLGQYFSLPTKYGIVGYDYPDSFRSHPSLGYNFSEDEVEQSDPRELIFDYGDPTDQPTDEIAARIWRETPSKYALGHQYYLANLFHQPFHAEYCYLNLVPEEYQEEAALRYGESPDWYDVYRDIFERYYENGLSDCVNDLSNTIWVEVTFDSTGPFSQFNNCIKLHLLSVGEPASNNRLRFQLRKSQFFQTTESSIFSIFAFPFYNSILIGGDHQSLRQPVINLSRVLVNEMREAGLSKDTFLNPIAQKITRAAASSTFNFPYKLNEFDFNNLNVEMNGSLIYTGRVRKSHAVVKFVDYFHKYQIACNFNKGDVVLFLGAKLREVVDALIKCPSMTPVVVYGERDAQDKLRREENLRFATSMLDKLHESKRLVEPISFKYYAFAGIHDDLIIDAENFPCKAEDVLKEYIKYYNSHSCNYHFTVSQVNKFRGKINILQMTNSIYDITVKEVAYYMRRFHIQMGYFTRIACADLYNTGYSINELLGVEFSRIGSKVAMTFKRDASKGYVHASENIEAWNLYTKFRTRNGLLTYEIQDSIFNYEMGQLSICDLVDIDAVCFKPVINMSHVRLFRVLPYLKYNKVEYFYVDRRKFDRIFDYCGRVSADSFDPTKICTMATSLKNTIRVGDSTVQLAWEIDQFTFYETLLFCILFSSLRKGQMIDLIIESIDLSKKGGYHPWVVKPFRESFKRYFMGYWDSTKMINQFDAIMRAPETLYWEPGTSLDISSRMTKIINTIRFGPLHSDHEANNLREMYKDMEDAYIHGHLFKLAHDAGVALVKAVGFYFRIQKFFFKMYTYPIRKPVEMLFAYVDNRIGLSEVFHQIYDDLSDLGERLKEKVPHYYVSIKKAIFDELYPEDDVSEVSENTSERMLRWINSVESATLEADEIYSQISESNESESTNATNSATTFSTGSDDSDDNNQPIPIVTTEEAEILFEEINHQSNEEAEASGTTDKGDLSPGNSLGSAQHNTENNKPLQFADIIKRNGKKNEQYFSNKKISKAFIAFINENAVITSFTSILDCCAGYGALANEARKLTARITAVELDATLQQHPNFDENLEWHFRDIFHHEDFNYDIVMSNPPFGAQHENKKNARRIFFRMFDRFHRHLAIIQQPEQVKYIIKNHLNIDDYDWETSVIHNFEIPRQYDHHTKAVSTIPVQFLFITRKTPLHSLKGRRSVKGSSRSKTTGHKQVRLSTTVQTFQHFPYGRQKSSSVV